MTSKRREDEDEIPVGRIWSPELKEKSTTISNTIVADISNTTTNTTEQGTLAPNTTSPP